MKIEKAEGCTVCVFYSDVQYRLNALKDCYKSGCTAVAGSSDVVRVHTSDKNKKPDFAYIAIKHVHLLYKSVNS